MNFKIKALPQFDKELKRLSKKYHSIKVDYADLLFELSLNPKLGTSLGQDCYKIRMNISSKSAGKSGGARVITCVKIINETIYLIAIYDKSDFESLSDDELNRRISGLK